MFKFWEALSKLNDLIGSWIETRYLNSIPGMKEKIKRGINTSLDECYQQTELDKIRQKIADRGDISEETIDEAVKWARRKN